MIAPHNAPVGLSVRTDIDHIDDQILRAAREVGGFHLLDHINQLVSKRTEALQPLMNQLNTRGVQHANLS